MRTTGWIHGDTNADSVKLDGFRLLEINFLKMYFDAMRFALKTHVYFRDEINARFDCFTWLHMVKAHQSLLPQLLPSAWPLA